MTGVESIKLLPQGMSSASVRLEMAGPGGRDLVFMCIEEIVL